MPVKNIKRRTNDGLEGVITGLTEEEKKILNEAVSGGALLVDTVDEMNALLGEKDLKDGQLCYCKETTTLYVLENDTWVETGGRGGYQIKKLTVTENGVYDSELEAYKPVVVRVPQTAASGSVKALLDATKSAYYLFYDYNGASVEGLIGFNDTANVINMRSMFSGCSNLTTIPALNTSKVTNMSNMFDYCYTLTSIPALDAAKVTNFNSVFGSCDNLRTIGIYGFTRTINIVVTALDHDALVAFLNQAGTAYDSSQKIIMGSTKLALLSDEEKAIATNKGWTLA